MKRLTERDEYGNADIIALSDVMPEIYAELSFSETNALTDALTRLAAYEDTDLEPKEINSKFIHEVLEENKRLKAKLERLISEENDPLTLDELREMDGEPVWVVSQDGRNESCWMLVDVEYELCREAHGGMAVFENYGKTWLAYRRKPEEV